MSRKISVSGRISKNYLRGNDAFFQETLDSENRIIYNTDINEFVAKKFISFGSGVARLKREAG